MGLRGPAARPVADRFSEKIAAADENGCVRWLAGTNGAGYGFLRLSPREGSRRMYAHRWFYEHYVGPIPDGAHLDHLCRNTLCVNPAHLEPVSQRTNVLRGISPCAENAAKTACKRGHELAGANLYINPSSGYRQCRECSRERDRQRRPRSRKKQS